MVKVQAPNQKRHYSNCKEKINMNYNEILAAARECVGPYCKACPVCNGKALRQLHARPRMQIPRQCGCQELR